MKNCKVCGDKTNVVVNIKLKAIPVCNSCCSSIFIQQARWYIDNENKVDDEESAECDENCTHEYESVMGPGVVCSKCGKYSDGFSI